MYTEFFHLTEAPFSITPDPAFVYMSPHHREALGHLLYGTGRQGGFVQLTGEVGTGKTTIVRTLLARELEAVDVALVLNPRQSEAEFVASICDELHVDYGAQASLKECVDALNRHLLQVHAQGRRTVLIIDEAQNLSFEVLEQVRLLTNLETSKDKLLSIMLIGQPELADMLARVELRQVAQRITARYHLAPLSLTETGEYIRHRLRVAGGDPDCFGVAAVKQVYRLSQGVPRLINILCDRALLGAYASSQHRISPELVRQAGAEVFGQATEIRADRPAAESRGRDLPWLVGGGVVALLAMVLIGVTLLRPGSFAPALPGDDAHAALDRVAPVAPVGPVQLAPKAPTPEPGKEQGPEPGQQPAPEPVRAAPSPRVEPPVVAAAVPAAPRAMVHATLPPATELPLRTLVEALLALWEVEVEIRPGERVCAAIARVGLACHRTEGQLVTLRSLNRPVILSTVSADGDTSYRLLTRLRDDAGQLHTPGGDVDVTIAALERAWNRDFLLFWRPDGHAGLIGPNSRGAAVQQLRAKLDRIAGRPDDGDYPGAYDDELATRVRAFQLSRGLKPDGLVGVHTWIALSDAEGAVHGPRLGGR